MEIKVAIKDEITLKDRVDASPLNEFFPISEKCVTKKTNDTQTNSVNVSAGSNGTGGINGSEAS